MAAKHRSNFSRFTPAALKAARPGDYIERPGLMLRVTPRGARSFRWRWRPKGGKLHVITIGPFSEKDAPGCVTLQQARQWAERLNTARQGGPAEVEKVEAEMAAFLAPAAAGAASPEVRTVAAVAEDWLRELDKQRKRPEQARYIVGKDILPMIGNVPLAALKKSDCKALIARVTARGATVHAGKVLALLKQLLDFAENVEDNFINPIARLKGKNLGVTQGTRDRWLNEREIPTFWAALDAAESRAVLERKREHARMRAALRLLLLTAVRSQELRLARWADVDLQAGTWTIPVPNQKLTLEQAKSAPPFIIPITPTARALFEEQRSLAGDSPWVLPGDGRTDAHEGHYTEKAIGKYMARLWPHPRGKWSGLPELRDVPRASPHNLRRTARTWLGKIGVLPHIAERCLNHKLAGGGQVERTYDRGSYFEDRRAALERWDACLRQLISGESNLVFLPAVGA